MEQRRWEFNSLHTKFFADATEFLDQTLTSLSSLSSHPLFSSIVTVYTLLLLYFPKLFLGIVLSPVLISTAILLLTLLRLGANQRVENESISDFDSIVEDRKWVSNVSKKFNSTELERTHDEIDSIAEDRKWVSIESDFEAGTVLGLDSDPFYADSFVEWNVRAPLEVIYEGYEGEEQNDDISNQREEKTIERYPSLSLYYPETDSDNSSDGDFPVIGEWESPETFCFRWEEEDREGLIEIELDGKRTREVFPAEEENLIEIDISPARFEVFGGGKG